MERLEFEYCLCRNYHFSKDLGIGVQILNANILGLILFVYIYTHILYIHIYTYTHTHTHTYLYTHTHIINIYLVPGTSGPWDAFVSKTITSLLSNVGQVISFWDSQFSHLWNHHHHHHHHLPTPLSIKDQKMPHREVMAARWQNRKPQILFLTKTLTTNK